MIRGKEVPMDDQQRYEKVRKRVREIKGFYSHLATYILINIFFLILNLLTSEGEYWFHWPLFGWGIGLVIHGLSVFGIPGLFGPDWEEKKIRQMMEKEKRKGL